MRAARVRHALRPRTRLREFRERRAYRRLAGSRILRAFAGAYPRAFFCEIGANDGAQHDPLRELILAHRWRGIMVEPVPFVFERLRRNYESLDRVELENAAIADRDGELPFFHLAEAPEAERAALPGWYDGIGSFSREAVLAHADAIPDVAERLVETTVPCMTVETLLERHGSPTLDLLLIDTEGYDGELIGHLDLERVRPRLLIFEHFHLDPDERRATVERLEAAGYVALAEGFDTFCLDARTDDGLLRAFRRTRPVKPAVSAHDGDDR